MDFSKLLVVLPQVASHPLAIAAYCLVIVVWALLVFKKNEAQTFLDALKLIPDAKKPDFVKKSKYNYNTLSQLESEQAKLAYLFRTYWLTAWFGTLFAILVFVTLWLSHAQKVAQLEAQLEAISDQRTLLGSELEKRDKLERLLLINSAGITNQLATNQDRVVQEAAQRLSKLLVDLAGLQSEESLSDEEQMVVRIAKSTVLLAEKKYSDALELISENDVEKATDRAVQLLKLRGDSYYGLGQWENAKKAYATLLTHSPNQLQIVFRSANCLLFLKQESDAIVQYDSFRKAAVAEKGTDLLWDLVVASWNNCGNANYGIKKFPEAIACYSEALKMMRSDPKYVEEKPLFVAMVTVNRAHAYDTVKKSKESAEDHQETERLIAKLKEADKSRSEATEIIEWLKTTAKPVPSGGKHGNKSCLSCHAMGA